MRIKGLRISGPTGSTWGPSNEWTDNKIFFKRGIVIRDDFGGLEVDNCELYNFPESAIGIGQYSSTSFNNNNIHHNYIHHNRGAGWGYGVVINNGFAKIHSNVFSSNRHDIAGTGKKETGYEASCNTVLQGEYASNDANQYNFDMHEDGGEGSGSTSSGRFIFIHHNDFLYTRNQNICICAKPDLQARIENNRFKHGGPTEAIGQACGNNTEGAFGNMLIFNNIYDSDNYLGWYVKKTWTKNNASNFMNIYSKNTNTELNINDFNDHIDTDFDNSLATGFGWLYIEDCRIIVPRTPAGTPYDVKLESSDYSLNFGDYDGDNSTDIFKLEDGKLYTIPYDASTYGISTDWTHILTTGYKMRDMRFGFFDGDNKTDIIVKNGSKVLMSSGCNSSWVQILNTGYDLDELHFGDFLGDGKTDLFLADGANFMFSNNANTSWSSMASSGYVFNDLLIGFFNFNNKSDVFLGDGANFYASYEGINSWAPLTSSGYSVRNDRLQSFDFNGDNISDILNENHEVSLGGNSSWTPTTTGFYPLSSFPYGDF